MDDLVQIVRCKDCKHWVYLFSWSYPVCDCDYWMEDYREDYPRTKADDYCSFGERKDAK